MMLTARHPEPLIDTDWSTEDLDDWYQLFSDEDLERLAEELADQEEAEGK